MAEVTNHMVVERISHILKNQTKKLLTSANKILFHKIFGHKKKLFEWYIILTSVILLICLIHIESHLSFVDKKQSITKSKL